MCLIIKGFVKLILIAVNFVFLLAGLIMLGFGIVTQSKPDLIIILLGKIPGISKIPAAFDLGGIFTASAVFMIILGGAVAGVGFFGCCGACCEDKCLLKIYIFVLAGVLVAEIILIIVAAVAPLKLKGTIQKAMNKSMKGFNEDLMLSDSGTLKLPNGPVSLGWTYLQIGADCCGTYNYSDYSSWSHKVTIKGMTYVATVPISCCAKTKDINLEASKSYDDSTFVNLTECLKRTKAFINPKNCFDSLFDIILRSRTIVIGIAVGIIAVEVVLIFLANVMRLAA